MTRREFEENVRSFGELLEFCWDNGLDYLDDVIGYDTMSEWIWDDIRDWDGSWERLSDCLAEVPRDSYTGYYRRNATLDYDGLDDDDFDMYKADLLAMIDPDSFDREEDQDVGNGYYFIDPMTGERFIAGETFEHVGLNDLLN